MLQPGVAQDKSSARRRIAERGGRHRHRLARHPRCQSSHGASGTCASVAAGSRSLWRRHCVTTGSIRERRRGGNTVSFNISTALFQVFISHRSTRRTRSGSTLPATAAVDCGEQTSPGGSGPLGLYGHNKKCQEGGEAAQETRRGAVLHFDTHTDWASGDMFVHIESRDVSPRVGEVPQP